MTFTLQSTLRRIYSSFLHSILPFPLSIFIPFLDTMPPTTSPLLDDLLDETIELTPVVKPVASPPSKSSADLSIKIPPEIRASIRLPPPTQRKKPTPKEDIVQCSSVKKAEMVPLLVLSEDGKLKKKSKVDFTTQEWRVNGVAQHHEIVAIDCHTGEVYKQVLSPQTLFVMMNDEKYKENCKKIEALSMPEEMQAIQIEDGNIIVSMPGINPPFSLDRLEGEQFTAYMLAEMEKEKNEQREVREAERQRWNEVTQEIIAASRKERIDTMERCSVNDSYINLLRRELTSMRAA